ncbi:antirestriction protein, partial [Plesiomonas shigelloides]
MTQSIALKVINYTDERTVTRLIVPEQARLDFWPQYFGSIPQWVLLEPQAFAWLDRLCDDYNGGFWDFYTLSNGGAFMAPESDENSEEKWSLFNPMNGNEAEVSAEAAGIIVCLLTYSHHACRTENSAMI